MGPGQPSASQARKLAANSGRNFLALGCTLLAHFVTLPIVVRCIGLDAFGTASLVLAVTAPLTVAGNALGQSTTREMAARLGAGDAQGAQQTLETARLLALVAVALGVAAIVGLGPPALQALSHQAHRGGAPWPLFAWAALGWAGQQATLLSQGACAAEQDFARMARVSAAAAVATVAATLGAVLAWPTAAGYLAGYALAWVLTALCWPLMPGQARGRGHRLRSHPGALAPLLHFGKWQLATQLAGTVSNQADRYMLASLVAPAVVGQYSTAKRLQEAVYTVAMKLAEVLYPHFGATASQDGGQRRRFYVHASWVVNTASVALLAPMVPLAGNLLRLWAGAEAAQGGGALLRTLALGSVVGCTCTVFTYCAMGLGMNRLNAWLTGLYSLLTIALSVLLLWRVGPEAAGAGLLGASVVRLVLASHWLRTRLFPGMPRHEMLNCTWLPLLAALGAALGLAASPLPALPWWGVALAYALTALAVAGASALLTACNAGGRDILRAVLRRPARGGMPGAHAARHGPYPPTTAGHGPTPGSARKTPNHAP